MNNLKNVSISFTFPQNSHQKVETLNKFSAFKVKTFEFLGSTVSTYLTAS